MEVIYVKKFSAIMILLIYENLSYNNQLHDSSKSEPIRRGIRQRYSRSSELFTLALETAFEIYSEWRGRTLLSCKRLNQFGYSYDIILRKKHQKMNRESIKFWLNMNLSKSRRMCMEDQNIEVKIRELFFSKDRYKKL